MRGSKAEGTHFGSPALFLKGDGQFICGTKTARLNLWGEQLFEAEERLAVEALMSEEERPYIQFWQKGVIQSAVHANTRILAAQF